MGRRRRTRSLACRALAGSTAVFFCKSSLSRVASGVRRRKLDPNCVRFSRPCATFTTLPQVLDLQKRVEGLLLSTDSPGAATAATEAAAAPQPTTTPHDVDRASPPRDESSAPPPFAREELGGNGGGGGASSDRRSCLRTRSSPTLSPTSDAAAAAAQDAGTDWPAAASHDSGGGGGGDATPPGGIGVRDGSRRSTIGPGTISADDSFGYALESFAARDGGGGHLQAGVLGWWRRGEWREGGNAEGAVKNQPLHPPAPAVVEDQERLGSLYSMIARR